MAKQLIVNADDLGRTPSVTEGILRAHQAGIVTSSTAMMNMPGVEAALQRARATCPRLGLGVHLVFSAGRPLLPPEQVSSLVDKDGYFLSQHAIAAAPHQINRSELIAEFQTQIQAFERSLGQPPDHLDAHHFAHLLPYLFESYLEMAERHKLPARLPLPRDECELAQRPPLSLSIVPPERLASLVRADWALIQQHPVRSSQRFEYSFFGDKALTNSYLLSILDTLPDGNTELMTHPGLADETLRQQSRYHVQREQELALLCDPVIQQHIANLGIALITFAALPG